MTIPSDARLDEILSAYGRMTFAQACTTSGQAARLTMNDSAVFLAVDGRYSAIDQAPFGDVQVSGAGLTRTITLGAQVEVTFDSDADLERFLRVLEVRKEAVAPHRAPARTSAPSASRRSSQFVQVPDPLDRYRQWSGYALMASALVLAIAWIDLAVGAILALVILLHGSPLAALIWLVVAVGGFALPACLGSATRMLVYRFQAEDAARG